MVQECVLADTSNGVGVHGNRIKSITASNQEVNVALYIDLMVLYISTVSWKSVSSEA